MNILTRIKEKILLFLLPRIKSSGYYAYRNIFEDLRVLVNKENPIIIDGGANLGETTYNFLKIFKNPTIYSFEPAPELVIVLEKKFMGKNNVNIIPKALGSQNQEISFNVAQNLASSSFLSQSSHLKKYHGDFIKTREVISVPMTTIDSFFQKGEVIDILKLDLEGYELEALKGSEKTLENTKIIMTESWFSAGYEEAPHFSDIEFYLKEKGFVLLNLYNPYTHKDMQLTTADAVFLNKKFFAGRKHFG